MTHDGCTQSSDEECDAIVAIVEEVLGRKVVDSAGRERRMEPKDILIVAPFNLQVRCLRGRLDQRIRVGSEALVVIVSLCASTLDEAPRGRVLAEPEPAERGGVARASSGDRGRIARARRGSM